MNTQAQAKLIVEEAVKFLATKHGTTEEQILTALEEGNEKLRRQIADLVTAAIAA